MPEVNINGTTVAGYLALPERGHGPGVLVLHTWWGLTPFFEEVCERLAAEGFVAFAPDRYGGPTAKTIEEAETLQQGREDWVRTEAVLRASVGFLGAHKAVVGEGLGALGFSAGAAFGRYCSRCANPILLRPLSPSTAQQGRSTTPGRGRLTWATTPRSMSGSQWMKCEGPKRHCVPLGAR